MVSQTILEELHCALIRKIRLMERAGEISSSAASKLIQELRASRKKILYG